MAAANALNFDYYLVIDFEATCDERKQPKPQEIIEFPVLKVNARTLETEAVFHTYVQPTEHPQLTGFCTELTGITQTMVDGKPKLAEVLDTFDQWMRDNGLLSSGVSFSFITCGDWDLKTMLPRQCSYFRIPMQPYFNKWINIQRLFIDVTHAQQDYHNLPGMASMLRYFNLTQDGRRHSGIDDAKNIAKILAELVK